MLSVIGFPPANPPPRVKSAVQKPKKPTKPVPIDTDEFDDEDFGEVITMPQKKKMHNVNEPVNFGGKLNKQEEEEDIPQPKAKSTSKQPKRPQEKPKPVEMYDEDQDEEQEEEVIVQPSKKKPAKAQERPATASTTTTKKPTSASKSQVASSTSKKQPGTKATSASTDKKNLASTAKNKKPQVIEDEELDENEQDDNSNYQTVPRGDFRKKTVINIAQKNQQMSVYKPIPTDEKVGEIILGNVGKKINVKNKDEIKQAKSKLNNLFATKKKEEINQNDEENPDAPTNQENPQSENFSNLLAEINNIEYKGYEYKIKESDYYVRNEKKIMTILNSEDAAIKKCEEIYASLGDKEKFFDKDFGSLPNDGGKANKASLYTDNVIPPGNLNPNLIEWYSISEINKNAMFFDDGTESNDVVQGSLGDCWFVSALSVLATKDYLLRGEFSPSILDDGVIDDEENVMMSTGVYPPIFHSFRKKGIFCFRFFKNFSWKYIIIDDRLPCQKVFNKNQTPNLIYGKCRSPREFWVPLIEKAYAKIHNSYQALVSGFIDDGLVDLTSLSAKKIMINPQDRTNPTKIEELWQLLYSNSQIDFGTKETKDKTGKVLTSKMFTRNKSMMGCSVDPAGQKNEMEVVLENQHTGILAGHAYSILDVIEIPKPRGTKPRKTSRLIRLRNPWGRKEWVGKWCDDSEEVNANEERIQEALNKKYEGTHEKININQEDGTFFMCFSDFRKIFNKLYICINYPPSYIGVRWIGKWTKQETGGLPLKGTQAEMEAFSRNPQYYMNKENDGMVYFSLLQNDGRLTGAKFPFPLSVKKGCLLIFRTKNKKKVANLNDMIEKTLIVQRRDLNIELNLPRGEYIIIPSTLEKHTEETPAQFCIEVYFEDQIISKGKGNTDAKSFDFDRLKFIRMEKLGGEPGSCELVTVDLGAEIKTVNENKKKFILSKFQDCLRDDDETTYEHGKNATSGGKGTANNKKVEEEEEEIDYDEY